MNLGFLLEKQPAVRFHASRLLMPLVRSAFGTLGKGSLIVNPLGVRGLDHIFIGTGVLVNEGTWLQAEMGSDLTIGNNVYIGHRCHIHAVDSLIIGDDTMIADGVTVSSGAHVGVNHSQVAKDGPIVIGQGVFIGEKALIKGGVTIGDGATIGAGAIVTRDIPAGATAGGVPAKVLSQGE